MDEPGASDEIEDDDDFTVRIESDGEVTLILGSTSGETFVRRLRPARALPENVDHGPAAEDATRMAAAVWGLPDFVFHAKVVALGSGVREVGDAIITVGDVAAVVQVKARTAPSADTRRERSWLQSRIRKATRQAIGTMRRFNAAAGVPMVNLRGREITVEGRSKAWVPVVVLDHPGAADYVPTSVAVVVLRRDWEFLFQQLKSTDAVVRYLHRVKDMSPVALGHEAMRYYDLASADAEAAPRVFDPRLVPKGARHISTPLLPREPAGHTDQRYHAVIRAILEDIALAPLAENIEESEVLDVLRRSTRCQ